MTLSVNTLPGSRDPYSSSHCYMWKEVRSLQVPCCFCRKVLWGRCRRRTLMKLMGDIQQPPGNCWAHRGGQQCLLCLDGGDFSLLFRAKYMEYYESRDLKAFPAEPLLVYPTRYTGQPGYLSDTETSTIWDKEAVSRDWDRTHPWKSPQHGKIHSDAQNKDALPSQSPLNAPSSRDELWLPASRGTVDS
uniref:Uncharacterized protein n=1 Tax=Amazona collaria TaxID=241587 RepID=A0A8B9IUQ4_9PSIT